MAKRICFVSNVSNNSVFQEIEVEFKYYNGFAISQKQKTILSLHESIKKIDKSLNILEISSKSDNPIGIALSAFNLLFFDEVTGKEYPVENIFQSSKVFERGGPYRDLLYVHPRDAKKDERLKNSGRLQYFIYNNIIWELEPKTMFYDWIYICSLYRNIDLSRRVMNYNTFTDIEFNQKKSVNCQARSAAIFVSMSRKGILEEFINDREKFKNMYAENKKDVVQMSLDL